MKIAQVVWVGVLWVELGGGNLEDDEKQSEIIRYDK
jgi:hypothetical protein